MQCIIVLLFVVERLFCFYVLKKNLARSLLSVIRECMHFIKFDIFCRFMCGVYELNMES